MTEKQVRTVLQTSIEPSAEFEAQLFSRADTLLADRRDRLARKTKPRLPLPDFRALLEPILFQPALQASLIAGLVIAVVWMTPKQSNRQAQLPEFSKTNDGPALYDALWDNERQAYEQEARHAREDSDGGI